VLDVDAAAQLPTERAVGAQPDVPAAAAAAGRQGAGQVFVLRAQGNECDIATVARVFVKHHVAAWRTDSDVVVGVCIPPRRDDADVGGGVLESVTAA
jgi:hypothetical protein